MTPWLIKALILEYLIISGFAVYERRGPQALYFFAAALISVAVLWMGMGKR